MTDFAIMTPADIGYDQHGIDGEDLDRYLEGFAARLNGRGQESCPHHGWGPAVAHKRALWLQGWADGAHHLDKPGEEE